MTMATENAAYTTEMAMDTRRGPTSSGRKVTPTASSAPETEPISTREASRRPNDPATAASALPAQNSAEYASSSVWRRKRPVVRASTGVATA